MILHLEIGRVNIGGLESWTIAETACVLETRMR
jgi:hypothetical protein